MNAVIAEESVVHGWASGFRAGLGAMTADAVFLGLTLLGFATLVERSPLVRAAMVGVGGLLMWYFAYGAARDARAAQQFVGGQRTDGGERASRGFRKTFVLALTNPYQVAFWLTVGVRLLQPGRMDLLRHAPYVGDALRGTVVVTTGSPALLVGLFAGIGCWIVGFPASLVAAGRRVDAFAPVVAGASALVLAGFGTVFLLDAVRTLLAVG
jgi:threonine/homoserine/homoserine lactone efflux protein